MNRIKCINVNKWNTKLKRKFSISNRTCKCCKNMRRNLKFSLITYKNKYKNE